MATKINQGMQAYDMQHLHHDHLHPIGKSSKNPHKISASFCEDVEMDPRPHVKMVIGHSKFWGLLDTGASISLITKKAILHLSKYLKLLRYRCVRTETISCR